MGMAQGMVSAGERSAILQFRDGSYIVGQLRNIGESWDRHFGYVVRREGGGSEVCVKCKVDGG
jgi:hypothetical protein